MRSTQTLVEIYNTYRFWHELFLEKLVLFKIIHESAVVAEQFKVCVKFKWTLTQRPWLESRSRHDNLYGRIYLVAIAPAIIVVQLYSHCRQNTILMAGSEPLIQEADPHIMKLAIGAQM